MTPEQIAKSDREWDEEPIRLVQLSEGPNPVVPFLIASIFFLVVMTAGIIWKMFFCC
jgi:hypothetical protein